MLNKKTTLINIEVVFLFLIKINKRLLQFYAMDFIEWFN